MSAGPLLDIKGLQAHYGHIDALFGIDLEVKKGSIVALVGANGAGKSTLLRVLSGVHPAAGGLVRFDGLDITRASAGDRVRAGICQSPEGRQMFGSMTVEDNLRLGAYVHGGGTTEDLDRAYAMFPVLAEKRHLAAGSLSGGQQQMLAITRALMGRPRLLLLDEPGLGLSPLLAKEVFRAIESLREQGLSILLIEQNAAAALKIADEGHVLETGRIVLRGSGDELMRNQMMKTAYLGL